MRRLGWRIIRTLRVNLHCRWKDEQTGENKYYWSIEDNGTLEIRRFDLPNRIVSGVFSCSAVNKDDSNDIIEITQGRFDFHWYNNHRKRISIKKKGVTTNNSLAIKINNHQLIIY